MPALFEDLPSLVDAPANFFLFFKGQFYDLHTGFRAASVVFFCTFFALDKQEVAAVVLAVGVIIARFAALMTGSNDIVGDALA